MKSSYKWMFALAWIGFSAGLVSGRNPDGTIDGLTYPDPAPLTTPTCLPCQTDISIQSITLEDSFGVCFDSDDLPDAGERIGVYVSGRSEDSCCWGPGDRTVTATTTYPLMTLLSSSQISSPQSENFLYLFVFDIDAAALCMETADIHVHAHADDGMFEDDDDQTVSYPIEVDSDGQGGYVCDVLPCGFESTGTPTVTPSSTMTPTSTPTSTETPTPTPIATDTPTPVPTATPTTCPPCYPVIDIDSIVIDDTIGSCSDGDGLIDAGEDIRFIVSGRSLNACCDGPGSVSVEIATDYPHMTLLGSGVNDANNYPFSRYFDFRIDSGAMCMDTAHVVITATVYDSPWYDEDERQLEYRIEVDSDGAGGYLCDTTPCEGTPTPAPAHTQSPMPSLTPTPVLPEIQTDLFLNQSAFNPGDPFYLLVRIWNRSSGALDDHRLAIAIEASGVYFWYPSWGTAFTSYRLDVPIGVASRDILSFQWPDCEGMHASARIYAALLDPAGSAIVGEWDFVDFAW